MVRREHNEVRCRDHDPGDRAAPEATHPVREDLGWHAADLIEVGRQHRQRGRRGLAPNDAHEPDPRPRQHLAEDHQPRRELAPVDHQHLPRHPDRWATLMTTELATLLLHQLCDNAPKVAVRADVAGGPSDRQEMPRLSTATGLTPLVYQRLHPAPKSRTRATPVLSVKVQRRPSEPKELRIATATRRTCFTHRRNVSREPMPRS